MVQLRVSRAQCLQHVSVCCLKSHFFFFFKTESAHAPVWIHTHKPLHVNAHNKPYTHCRRGINQVHPHFTSTITAPTPHPHTQGSSSHTHKLQGPLQSQDRTQGPLLSHDHFASHDLNFFLEWNVYAWGSSETPLSLFYYYYYFTINISWFNCNSQQ